MGPKNTLAHQRHQPNGLLVGEKWAMMPNIRNAVDICNFKRETRSGFGVPRVERHPVCKLPPKKTTKLQFSDKSSSQPFLGGRFFVSFFFLKIDFLQQV